MKRKHYINKVLCIQKQSFETSMLQIYDFNAFDIRLCLDHRLKIHTS